MTDLNSFSEPTLPSSLPTGFDHQVDRIRDLVMEAFGLASRDEILSVAKILGMAAAGGTIFANGEADNARMIEWSAFHVRRHDQSLIQILLQQMPSTANKRDRAILCALATSTWDIYRVEAIQPNVGAVVVDYWGKTRQVIYSRSFQNQVKVGEALMGRRIVVGDLATMTAVISRIPEPILDRLKNISGFGLDDNPMQDPQRQEQLAVKIFGARSATGHRTNEGTPAPSATGGGNRQRNQPCPCGSGKKFKHCCSTGK